MTTQRLIPCPYRRGQRGNLICTVAQQIGGSTSNIISAQVCQKCEVPIRLKQSNCKHLQCGTEVFRVSNYQGDFSDLQATIFDCPIYAFESEKDLFGQCAGECPSRKYIHRNIDDDPLLRVPKMPSMPTDRDIRQGVLFSLYEYHASFPERFLDFDITPARLAESLNLKVNDIHRVIGPMDEAGEVRTLKDTGDILSRFVTITQKGIEAINHEPLFENKGIRVTDNSIKIEGNHNQIAREHGRNEQINLQAQSPEIAQVIEQLQALRIKVEQETAFVDVQSEALDTIDAVLEETQRPEPRQNRVVTGLRALNRLMEGNPTTAALAGAAVQSLIDRFANGG